MDHRDIKENQEAKVGATTARAKSQYERTEADASSK
jgi:hypothetical protein